MNDCAIWPSVCDASCWECVRAVEARDRASVRGVPSFDGERVGVWEMLGGVAVLLGLIVGVAWLTALL